jgi:integrase
MQRGAVWHFWGYDYAGKKYTASTHQTDRKAALDAAREIERDKSVPAPDQTQTAQELTLAEALGLLGQHDARVNAAPKTVQFHVDRGRHLVRLLLPDTRLIDVTPPAPTLVAYTDTRLAENASRHTIQKELRVLRQAKAVGGYSGDPKSLTVEGFKRAKGKRGYYKPGARWLRKPEWIGALIAETSSNPDRHRIDRRDDILTLVNLGLRRRELLVICREHVDLVKRVLKLEELVRGGVVVRELKTDGSARPLPLNDVMLALFTRRMRNARVGTPLFTEWGSGNRDLRANWKRARASLLARAKKGDARQDLDVELPKSLTFNDLRRTFCSLMKNAGVSFEDCAELLGHQDIAMVRLVYGHTDMARLHAAVAKLPPMALPPVALPRARKPSRRQLQKQRLQARTGAISTAAQTAEARPAQTAYVSAVNAMGKKGSKGAS